MEKRIDKIKKEIELSGEVFVTDLSRKYDVTEETIRRDLEKLKNEGLITRTFGGAVLNTVSQKDHIHFFKRRSINNEEKKKIAEIVCGRLSDVNTIMADNSTTVMEVVKLIKSNSDITAISFSTQILQELEGAKMKVISTGGTYDENSFSFQGTLAKENIARYNVDVALLACKALDIEKGIMDSTEGEAVLKSEMAKRASKVILLADHTKFNQTAFVNFLTWGDVDCIVTDKKPDDRWLDFCAGNNIELLYE